MSNDAMREIRMAIKDLLYMSETDSPFEIVYWKKQDAIRSSADLLSLIGKSSGLPIQDVGVGKVFSGLDARPGMAQTQKARRPSKNTAVY